LQQLCLQYVFSFSYGEDGEVHMVTTGGRRSRQKFDTKDSKLGKVGGGVPIQLLPCLTCYLLPGCR
jgi:hypothetical protein